MPTTKLLYPVIVILLFEFLYAVFYQLEQRGSVKDAAQCSQFEVELSLFNRRLFSLFLFALFEHN